MIRVLYIIVFILIGSQVCAQEETIEYFSMLRASDEVNLLEHLKTAEVQHFLQELPTIRKEVWSGPPPPVSPPVSSQGSPELYSLWNIPFPVWVFPPPPMTYIQYVDQYAIIIRIRQKDGAIKYDYFAILPNFRIINIMGGTVAFDSIQPLIEYAIPLMEYKHPWFFCDGWDYTRMNFDSMNRENQGDQKTNIGLSLRLFGESEHSCVKGLDLSFWDTSSVRNINKRGIDDFRGLNLGIVSGFVGDMNGVQGNLLASYGRTVKGIQFALLSGSERLTGCQLGLISFVGRDVHGLQLGLLNSVGYDVHGLQLGLLNGVVSDTNGCQLGLVNASGSVNGLQLGLLNVGEDVNGLQLGLINGVVYDVNSCQLGLVNGSSGNVNGYQIGLINFSSEGVSGGAQIGLLNFKKGDWWVIPFVRIGFAE